MGSERGPGQGRRQRSDEASAHVRALIMSGELRPGTLVRPESIGEALGISATPAREALQVLRVEGFVTLVPSRGFAVAPLTGGDIRDLFRVHALIAGELAARAATHANDADVAELEAVHHELIAAARRCDHALLEAKNHAFHRHVTLMAKSRKTAWALSVVSRYVPRRFYAAIPGWPQATVDDHGRVLEAIQARSPAAAREAMIEHLAHAGELLAENFDERMTEEGHPSIR